MHNFEVARGFSLQQDDTTVMFCRSCGLSYRLTTYGYKSDLSARAVWESMTMEKPDGEVLAIAPCHVEPIKAGGNDDTF